MAVVASTIRGILGLIDNLGISQKYPDQDWVNSELVPTLRTLVNRLGSVEQSLHSKNNRDWTLWVVVSVFGLTTMATAFLIYKQMSRTRSKVATVSKGVVSVGTKMNVRGEQPFPEMKF